MLANHCLVVIFLLYQLTCIKSFLSGDWGCGRYIKLFGIRRQNLLSSCEDEMFDDSVFTCYVPNKVSREQAQELMDTVILPMIDYDKRIQYGGDAQGYKSLVVTVDDPNGSLTYGEFPFSSMDQLIDLALDQYLSKKQRMTMVDLGSGCGRLVLYSALSRGLKEDTKWTIHGIEISRVLHDEALRATLTGIDNQWFHTEPMNDSDNLFVLHLGPANEYPDTLQQADIIFCYSTAFDATNFSEELGAMILGQEWNQLLQQNCRPGTIAITTDRALDPNYGWKLVDRLDVDNREVFGSTGYIHILQEK